MAHGEAVRKAITDAYYEARNNGRTMEDAADDATTAVLGVTSAEVAIAWRADITATPEEQGLTPGGGRQSFDEAWTDLIREFPTKRDATIRAILDKHRAALRIAR